ncbi:MAG: 16S rRNA (cytidine(1402)-2'-O)-methyltransferase, partial [Ruminiclostridium sp.]
MSEKGTLYLVATPIGNLQDITFRAVNTLKEVDVIAAEDTRQSIKLLNHFEIKKPLISYHEHNKNVKGNYLIEQLLTGKNIALVSDAGSPGISDPGEELVKLAIENNIIVTMIPGPVAAVTGLVISGLSTGRFVFEGFLPMNKRTRQERL